MAESVVRPEDLLVANWRELRSEVSLWEEGDDGAEGFDGYSRYWCQEAVFDVYWVAERLNQSEVALYLTSDMLLTGFKSPLTFEVSGEFMADLAKKIHWENVATAALRTFFGQQN